MVLLESVNYMAFNYWFPDMTFTISLMYAISLIVLVRWNWFGAIFPVLDGILYCVFYGATVQMYVIYAVGNAFLLLSWFIFKAIPKNKLFSTWYLTLIYPLAATALVFLGRSTVAACFGFGFVDTLRENLWDLLSGAFAAMVLLVARKVDGMLEDQKQYLLRLEEEKKGHPADEDKWEGYTELNEDELKYFRADYGSLFDKPVPSASISADKNPKTPDKRARKSEKRAGPADKISEESENAAVKADTESHAADIAQNNVGQSDSVQIDTVPEEIDVKTE